MRPAGDDPALARIWELALTARERRGADGDARLKVQELTEAEADALDALPWPGRAKRILTGSDLRVSLSRFEAAVAASGSDLQDAYANFAGHTPRDLRMERSAQTARATAEKNKVREHPAALARPPLAAALASRPLRLNDVPHWLRALEVVEALPRTPPVERSVLSAELFAGDAHALDAGSRVEALVRELLEHLDGSGSSARAPREVWIRWGVEIDPLSSTVLTLNLAAQPGSQLAPALKALRGSHAVLTLAQLEAQEPDWERTEVYVCENPTVVRAAERRLGEACRPLVCTGGWPSAAVARLLGQLNESGSQLHHHGDYDWDGLAIHQALRRDHDVVPWRYDVQSYRAAVAASPVPLLALGPRRREVHGPLADALAFSGQHVAEERVLAELLDDLRLPSD